MTVLADYNQLNAIQEHAVEIRSCLKRIVDSQTFIRSEQLRRLLLYLCEEVLAGRGSDLHEQQIGVSVFGRVQGYDPSIDGIVRTHATRLRQRLEQYFNQEGATERIHIEVPRGCYVPHFYMKVSSEKVLGPASCDLSERLALAPAPGALQLEIPRPRSLYKPKKHTAILAFLYGAMLVSLVIALAFHLRADSTLRNDTAGTEQSEVEQRFWSSLLNARERTRIIVGDSGLVMYETFAGREVSLGDYLQGRYRDDKTLDHPAQSKRDQIVTNLAGRRYTSEADLRLAVALSKLPGWNNSRNEIIFARDLRPSDATGSNLVLIGSRQTDPWLALVDSKLNFMLRPDQVRGFYYLNRAPRPNELPRYEAGQTTEGQQVPTTYGHVAYLPNPSGKGMILVLEGLWMSGTEAAGHFVLNGSGFCDWLLTIRRPDGSIPAFELLLAAKALDSSAEDIEVVARRVQP